MVAIVAAFRQTGKSSAQPACSVAANEKVLESRDSERVKEIELEHRASSENREERRMDGGKRRFDGVQHRSPEVSIGVARATGLDQ